MKNEDSDMIVSMNRIAIVGISGSGKSTFANKLGKNLNRPVIHLDKEYWTSNWGERYDSKEEWRNFQRELVKNDQWIIDGNYQSSLDIRLDRADTIIFFDFPKWRCLWQALVRVFNREQPFDKPEGAKEKISWALIKFILNYPTAKNRNIIDGYKNQCQIFVVRNNREVHELLLRVSKV